MRRSQRIKKGKNGKNNKKGEGVQKGKDDRLEEFFDVL